MHDVIVLKFAGGSPYITVTCKFKMYSAVNAMKFNDHVFLKVRPEIRSRIFAGNMGDIARVCVVIEP